MRQNATEPGGFQPLARFCCWGVLNSERGTEDRDLESCAGSVRLWAADLPHSDIYSSHLSDWFYFTPAQWCCHPDFEVPGWRESPAK